MSTTVLASTLQSATTFLGGKTKDSKLETESVSSSDSWSETEAGLMMEVGSCVEWVELACSVEVRVRVGDSGDESGRAEKSMA